MRSKNLEVYYISLPWIHWNENCIRGIVTTLSNVTIHPLKSNCRLELPYPPFNFDSVNILHFTFTIVSCLVCQGFLIIITLVCRGPGGQELHPLRLLPRPLPRHHLHHQDTQTDPLLLLQPDRPLHPDRQHGGAGVHPPPGLGGEVITRYKTLDCRLNVLGTVLDINCWNISPFSPWLDSKDKRH